MEGSKADSATGRGAQGCRLIKLAIPFLNEAKAWRELLAAAGRARDESGIGLLRQLSQIAYLACRPGGIDPWEYYFFRVYEDQYSMREKLRFAGWRRELWLDRRTNAPASTPQQTLSRLCRGRRLAQPISRRRANNKLIFQNLMKQADAPVPALKAVFRARQETTSVVRRLNDAEAVENFLRDRDAYPLFVKPIMGARGWATRALRDFDPVTGKIETLAGPTIDPRVLAADLDVQSPQGFLFQELLKTDRILADACGDRLTTVRAIVALREAGPTLISAVWRIPTGSNEIDNFSVGQTGNIAARIDLVTGRIGRTVQGRGWETLDIRHHPDTGKPIEGLALPGWPDVKKTCLAAARAFPDLLFQHWDVALTDHGPVLLEINVEGGLRTHQLVQQRGIFGARLNALARSRTRSRQRVRASMPPVPRVHRESRRQDQEVAYK